MKPTVLFLRICCLVAGCYTYHCAAAQALPEQNDRWAITPAGSIEWKVTDRLPHMDHIEMAGEKIALWLQYSVDTAYRPHVSRTLVFPGFRLVPNKTASSMMYTVEDADLPRFFIDDKLMRAGIYNGGFSADMPEKVSAIRQKGIMEISSWLGKNNSLQLTRSFFPSANQPLAIEKWVFINTGSKAVKIEMEALNRVIKPAVTRTVHGPHRFVVSTLNDGEKNVQPGDSVVYAITYQAVHGNDQPLVAVVNEEEALRLNRVGQVQSLLRLETPDTLLNTAFAFAKLRATESIYLTRGGYMHGPGGLRYYAAIWANDQAEYVNPFFAFLGDDIAVKSAMNAFRLFAQYMNPAYTPIPSSIIAEGEGTWHGAKDRGDMAMIAYGASRFALAYGDADSAQRLWPLIEWCLEYLHRKINAQGVVASNSDELEGRFPAGDANLQTSVLYYDALRSAAMLGTALGKPRAAMQGYWKEAESMKNNIEQFFGSTVEGFATYRYYEGNNVLRAWICSPLVMGIMNRKQGTLDALFSSRLWTADGLATQAGDKTFWDRSTLYGLRGAFNAGATEQAMRFLKYYSRRRLLGEHVPYPVEAYPEGNQRHLSAESGLYCRIYTEGMFGIRPTGFTSFDCTPRLPEEWNSMALKNIHAFAHVFNLEITRKNKNQLQIRVVDDQGKEKKYLVKEGATQPVQL